MFDERKIRKGQLGIGIQLPWSKGNKKFPSLENKKIKSSQVLKTRK
jgi:hypothetical protein